MKSLSDFKLPTERYFTLGLFFAFIISFAKRDRAKLVLWPGPIILKVRVITTGICSFLLYFNAICSCETLVIP